MDKLTQACIAQTGSQNTYTDMPRPKDPYGWI